MIIVMLWRPHGGGGHGHASLSITRPKANGVGNEGIGVITWFPSGPLEKGSFPGTGSTAHHAVPASVYEEMSAFMMKKGTVREVFMQGVPSGQRPTTQIKPPSDIIHLTSLSDTDAMAGLSDENMLKWWDQYKLRDDYNVVTRNCSTAVAGALMAGGGSLYAKPPAFTSIAWTPEKVFEWAIEIAKKLEPLNDRLNAARKTLADLAKDNTDKDVWDIATWKQKSSIALAHRYQLMKDIDTCLAEYHQQRHDSAKNQGLATHEIEISKLGQLVDRICKQLIERPKSARREAVLHLGAQVLKRIEVVKGAIREIQREAERKAKEKKEALTKQYNEIKAKYDQLSEQATKEQRTVFRKIPKKQEDIQEWQKLKSHLMQVLKAMGSAKEEADKILEELQKLP